MNRLRTVSSQRYFSSREALLSLSPSEATKSFFIWLTVVIAESSICVVMANYGRKTPLFQAKADFMLILCWKWAIFHAHLALDNSGITATTADYAIIYINRL